MQKVYTLKKKAETGEMHLFECEPYNVSCICNQLCICERMSKAEDDTNIFTCLEEDMARIKAAHLGRLVCGVCISHLYQTYVD